jgi:hypothetical protein
MSLDTYDLNVDTDARGFNFTSEGKKGRIEKIIRFIEETDSVYNLAFGDKKGENEIDDFSRSDNGDTKKVLATIAAAVEMFSTVFPGSWIHVKGSTMSRTRLYQININRHFSEISSLFDVYGLRDKCWEEFKPGLSYHEFLVRKRKFIFEY